MIKLLDVGYLINCRHKIKQEDKLVVTSCVLKVIRHKIKKGLHLFLEKFDIIRDFVKNYYSTKTGKRRRRSPKKIAEEMVQLLELKGYADVAFLFRVITQYHNHGIPEARLLTTDHRLPNTAHPFEDIKVEVVDCQA
jgi:hypothetical protein